MTTRIESATGPVSAGSGDQTNNFNYYLDHESGRLTRQGKDPMRVARDDLHWLARRFVEPRDLGEATERLTRPGMVLLTGDPGTGRRSAAKMLLHDIGRDGGRFEELHDDPESSLSSQIAAGGRYLLDLSATDEDRFRSVQPELGSVRAALEQHEARLVAVLPRHHEHLLRDEFSNLVVGIGRPNGSRVLKKHLLADGIDFRDSDLGVPELAGYLESAAMRELRELSRLTRLASEADRSGGFPAWLAQAINARKERGAEVAARVRANRDGWSRALLLSTAMLIGCRSDAVFHAAARLLAVVGHTPDDTPALEQADLAERLADIGVGVERDQRVRFDTLAYDEAVLTHFWNNFPDLRLSYRTWVDKLVRLRVLGEADRSAVVPRFAAQALRVGHPDDLVHLVKRWAERTESGRPSPYLPLAAEALTLGLRHEEHGGHFRSQIYSWSRDQGLPRDLALVVVQVCADVLAPDHPDQALVRLHHLARRGRGVVRAAARDALLGLVERDRRQLRRLLDRLAGEQASPHWTGADAGLFLELVGSTPFTDRMRADRRLLGDTTVRAQLVKGWSSVLTGRGRDVWGGGVRSWLEFSATDTRPLDVLVEAVRDDGDALGGLYVTARDWAHEDPSRAATRDSLLRRIDRAQGFEADELTTEDSQERQR
ncbi:hypothetical protein HUO13_22065 [Saccharopolyspora erythraea]|uniref:hypothetical protein n=1 Tax=Saccharopolyspora erythraea TaxID=1836 RepID=UPI001BAE4630|nr:hypothetical protein [Saccharopolyspora erythraea]QUH03149.1 hypothetical protein HUO13_22065 [Saccharopolyspora erythraea]